MAHRGGSQRTDTTQQSDGLLHIRMNTAKKNIHMQERMLYKGKGIGIAVLDTGISPVNDFLLPRRRIAAFRDFVNGRVSPYDDNGHGTHVTCVPRQIPKALFFK